MLLNMYRKCYAKIENNSQKKPSRSYRFISVKTMTAPAAWQSCLRAMYDSLVRCHATFRL